MSRLTPLEWGALIGSAPFAFLVGVIWGLVGGFFWLLAGLSEPDGWFNRLWAKALRREKDGKVDP